MRPLISIIVPVYNTEKYLDECVSSLVSQTYQNLEIILIDDGSNDNSPKICDKWASIDSRIVVYHNANRGVSEARNYGIERAHGAYIAFVDSDDYVHPEMIERAFTALKNNHVLMVAFNYCTVLNNNSLIHKEYSTNCIKLNSEEALIRMLHDDRTITNHCWRYLYNAEIIHHTPFPAGEIHEDMATTYKRLILAEEIALLKDVLYYYRNTPQSITHVFSCQNAYDLMSACRKREEDLLLSYPYLKEELQFNRGLILFKLYLATQKAYSNDKENEEYAPLLKHIQWEMKDSKISKDVSLKAKCAYYLIRFFPSFANWYFRK